MNINIRKIVKDIKNSNYIPFFMLIVSSIILFSPDKWMNKLHLEQFIIDYGWIIGLMFIISIVLIVLNFLLAIRDGINYTLEEVSKSQQRK